MVCPAIFSPYFLSYMISCRNILNISWRPDGRLKGTYTYYIIKSWCISTAPNMITYFLRPPPIVFLSRGNSVITDKKARQGPTLVLLSQCTDWKQSYYLAIGWLYGSQGPITFQLFPGSPYFNHQYNLHNWWVGHWNKAESTNLWGIVFSHEAIEANLV